MARRAKDKPVPENDIGLLVKGKLVNTYKKEYADLAGVNPSEISVTFNRNRDTGQVEDIDCRVKASGKFNKAHKMGVKSITIKEVCPVYQMDKPGSEVESKRREIEATVTFGPDLNRARAVIQTLRPIAEFMDKDVLSKVIAGAMQDRVFQNRAHRDPDDGGMQDRQKPHVLELAITAAITRAVDLGTGGGYAVADDMEHEEPPDTDEGLAGVDDAPMSETASTRIKPCEVLYGSIMGGIEEVGIETLLTFLNYEDGEEKFRALMERYVRDGEVSLLEDMLVSVQQCVNMKE